MCGHVQIMFCSDNQASKLVYINVLMISSKNWLQKTLEDLLQNYYLDSIVIIISSLRRRVLSQLGGYSPGTALQY